MMSANLKGISFGLRFDRGGLSILTDQVIITLPRILFVSVFEALTP